MTTINVVFQATWLTDITNPTASLQVWKTARVEDDSLDAQVRDYAGRRRIITTPKRDRSTQLTLRRVSPTDLETLRGWRGRLLLLRDAQGWRRWGTFPSVAASMAPMTSHYEVGLTFLEVDFEEGPARPSTVSGVIEDPSGWFTDIDLVEDPAGSGWFDFDESLVTDGDVYGAPYGTPY